MSQRRKVPSNRDPIGEIRRIFLAFPEAVEKPFGGHTAPAFGVREKLFATTSEDGTYLTCKAPPGVQPALVGSDPSRFFVPPYVGHKGWVGIRLHVGDRLGKQDWDELAEILEDSYRAVAPKRLSALLDRDRARSGVGQVP